MSQAKLPATARMGLRQRRHARLWRSQSIDLHGSGKWLLAFDDDEESTIVIYEKWISIHRNTEWVCSNIITTESHDKFWSYKVSPGRWLTLRGRGSVTDATRISEDPVAWSLMRTAKRPGNIV